jgi:hypothetical protein
MNLTDLKCTESDQWRKRNEGMICVHFSLTFEFLSLSWLIEAESARKPKPLEFISLPCYPGARLFLYLSRSFAGRRIRCYSRLRPRAGGFKAWLEVRTSPVPLCFSVVEETWTKAVIAELEGLHRRMVDFCV